jgi:hypothetical protein
MGIFGKLKENFNHGGIKIQLQAPATVSMNDAAVPVTVNVSATEEQRTVENIRVNITAQSQNQGFNEPTNQNIGMPETAQGAQHVVAEANYTQPFSIMPGETKTIKLSIVMNAGAAVGAQLPEGSGMAQVAGALQKLQSISEAMNGNSYQYFIQVSAKIEGVTLGPSYQQSIQILKPGEMGGAIQKNIQL